MGKDTLNLFLFPRKLRDDIYDILLFAPIGDVVRSPSLSDLIPVGRRRQLPWRKIGPGSCFGMMYSCKQAYNEFFESIERHDGIPFELKLTIFRKSSLEEEYYWPNWIVFPLCAYPNPRLYPNQATTVQSPSPSESQAATRNNSNSKCRSFHLTFNIQSERFRWWGGGGPAFLTRNLFSMLADFLLGGPFALAHQSLTSKSKEGNMWDIDTLIVDVVGSGTPFTDPFTGQPHTVPVGVGENIVRCLSMHLNRICTAGALSKRVRAVKLAVEGEIKREWIINQERSLSEEREKDWAGYGWVVERK